MNKDIIAAVLHLKEASRLLLDIHPELSQTLLNVANAFIHSDDDLLEINEMESVANTILEQSDESIN
jgi:hypothetical protein